MRPSPSSRSRRPSPLNGRERAHQFNRLFLEHVEGAYQLAHYLTGDPERCELAVGEALAWAFRDFDLYRGGSPRAWLFAIVRNRCHALEAGAGGSISLLMRESGLTGVSGLLGTSPARHRCDVNDPLADEHSPGDVRLVIDAIPEPFREPVVLTELQHFSSAEVAEVTGLPVRTVMARLALGRWMVKEELLALPRDAPPVPGRFG